MPTRKDDLEIAVLELPVGERAELARRLIESLDDSDAGNFETEWIEEADRRYASYRAQVNDPRLKAWACSGSLKATFRAKLG